MMTYLLNSGSLVSLINIYQIQDPQFMSGIASGHYDISGHGYSTLVSSEGCKCYIYA